MSEEQRIRCPWVRSELEARYHDEEWGRPEHNDERLFELLTLEGAQAGLSWETVLKKRDGYRVGFYNFDIDRVAAMSPEEVAELATNPGVVRHRSKLASVITNAKAAQAVILEFGSLDAYLWSFVGGVTRVNSPETLNDYVAQSDESRAMSAALMQRGFKFVGPTICYAFMQATGMVNDHTLDCWCRNIG